MTPQEPLGTLPDVGASDTPEGLAENESAPLEALSGPMTSVRRWSRC